MFATGVPSENAEPIEVNTIDDCKRYYEQERKKIDEFGNPDKFLCLRYSSEDGCSKFEEVDMKFGYGYSDLADTDKLEKLNQLFFGSFGSVVCCVGCWFSKDGKRNISGFSIDLDSPDPEWKEAPNLNFSAILHNLLFTKTDSFWSRRTAIVDDVIYTHHSGARPIGAYDLEEMKMIDVDWELDFGCGIGDEYKWWSGFFHLGDGILCLARCE